jgi:O-antigen/teichoic acid export membrane protein
MFVPHHRPRISIPIEATTILTQGAPQNYGGVALVSVVGVVMSGLFTLGTGNSMGVLHYRESDIAKRPTIIWSNVLLFTVNGVFWYSIVFVSAPMLSAFMFQSDRYADLIRIALLGSVFSTIADPWLAYLRMEEKARRYVVITLNWIEFPKRLYLV